MPSTGGFHPRFQSSAIKPSDRVGDGNTHNTNPSGGAPDPRVRSGENLRVEMRSDSVKRLEEDNRALGHLALSVAPPGGLEDNCN